MVRLPGRGAREEQPKDNVVDLLQHRLQRSRESMRSAGEAMDQGTEASAQDPAAPPQAAQPQAAPRKQPDPWSRALENVVRNSKRPAA